MADIETAAWSETAASNIQPSPDGWPPNSSPNIVYTTDREMMGAIKRDWNRRNPTVTSGGSANVQTLTYTTAPAAYVRGQCYCFVAGFSNTGALTLNVNGLGAKAVQIATAALVGGEIIANSVVEVVYDGTQFQIISGSGYLPLAGGTLSGALTIAPTATHSLFYLNKPAGAFTTAITGETAGSLRWQIVPGNSTAEAAGNVGSDFAISRFDNTGTFIDVPLTIMRSSGAVAMKGDNSGAVAAAGFVGEIISSNITAGISLTNGTAINVTSISLTAGDWDVVGEIWLIVGTGGTTNTQAAISQTSATIPGTPALNISRLSMPVTSAASNPVVLPLRTARLSVSTTTVLYLVVQVFFPSGTTTASGNISARRMR